MQFVTSTCANALKIMIITSIPASSTFLVFHCAYGSMLTNCQSADLAKTPECGLTLLATSPLLTLCFLLLCGRSEAKSKKYQEYRKLMQLLTKVPQTGQFVWLTYTQLFQELRELMPKKMAIFFINLG